MVSPSLHFGGRRAAWSPSERWGLQDTPLTSSEKEKLPRMGNASGRNKLIYEHGLYYFRTFLVRASSLAVKQGWTRLIIVPGEKNNSNQTVWYGGLPHPTLETH